MKKDNGSRDSLEEIFSKDDKFPKGMIGIFKTAEINLLSTFDKLAPTKAYLVSDPLSLNTKKERKA